jgi:phage terminase large subunit GpA-like protein
MDRDPDYRRDQGVLPDFASVWGAVREALPAVAPAQRVTVPAAAAEHRIVDAPGYRGPWRNDVAPQMVEPAEIMTSRRFEGVIFVGPARTLKTDALVLNTIVHRIMTGPRDMRVVHMSKDTAREFSLSTIDKMLRSSPAVRARLVEGRRSDNIFDKQFAGGMRLTIAWPVIAQLSAATLPDVLFTDYDRMPDDVDGEGEPFALGKKRNETVGSIGKVMAESSPGRPILDAEWKAATPHEPPPTTGILSLYGQGTRARLYWPCAHCGKLYEPRFSLLRWPEGAPPIEAGEQALMHCPLCAAPQSPDLKRQLLAESVWLHEAADGGIGGHLEGLTRIDGNIRRAGLASYWMFGPAASFQTWAKLVAAYLTAEEVYRRTGDEKPLQVTVNVDQGDAYRPRAMGTASLLTETELKKRAIKGYEHDPRLVPGNTRFITIQVDVQANRFVVQADSWAELLERCLVDRFELFKPFDDSERAIDPARYLADWDCLFDLLDREYEVDATGFTLKPAFIVVDSGGAPGVTANAYKFWRKARSRGLGNRIMLVRGNHVKKGLPDAQRRAYKAFPERSTENGRKTQLDVPVIWAGTDVLKDEISAALTRDEIGEGSYNVLNRVDEQVYAELAAERRSESGWDKRPGVLRNEALDLAVYGKAVVIVAGGEKIDWSVPVDWAAPMRRNAYAAAIEGRVRDEGAAQNEVTEQPAATRRDGGWLGGRRRGFLGR